MNLGAPAWLMLLAAALYLWDAALLLPSDAFVLVRHGRRGWRPAFGANGWTLRGREPLLPNPLTPWREIVHAGWRADALPDASATPTARLPTVGRAPRIGVTVLLALIFGALPLGLFVYPVLVVVLPIAAAIYLACLATLLALRRERDALGIAPAAFRSLCWECITCPPFCINAVRKAGLLAPARASLADVTDPADRAAARRQIALRLREQIDLAPEHGAQAARLQAALRAIDDAP